jgi:hypothetical protein
MTRVLLDTSAYSAFMRGHPLLRLPDEQIRQLDRAPSTWPATSA